MNTIKVATDLERGSPFFIILKHKTINSVFTRKLIDSMSSFLTKAPITPKEVTLKCSNDFFLSEELIKG